MRTFYFNPNLRWLVLGALAFLPFFLLLRSMAVSAPDEEAAADRVSNDRVQQLEEAVVELQKQLAEEKDLEKDLMETLQKYKKVIVKRSRAPATGASLPNGGPSEEKFLDCQAIDRIQITQQVAQGHSKVVQEGKLGDKHYAVKSTSYDVKIVKDCVQGGTYKKKEDCFILGTYQVLKEAMMLKQLQHPNIVRLLGLCVRSENSSPIIHERGVTVIEELGSPVFLRDLTDMDFRAKIEVCLDLARLLQYLADSPMGSVAITDWRDEQFVFVGGQLKIADVDGLNSKEPACNKDMKCLINNMPYGIRCAKNMECPGTNARTNLLQARTHFLDPMLGNGIPVECLAKTTALLTDVQNNKLDAEDLVDRLEDLLKFVDTVTKLPPLEVERGQEDYY
ncbi:extracellular tyrosine-protein kinase PKDCC-like [Acanthaster planci]|uniref:Extracellular tyrosine-protein kinase PKDCC-like n=1 Tax=Acanthaster planci TaxID=133434 RepID=A0A8B7Z832_ACAPL|nr:extracellular tyrosine-protein kinase PKDCC-like [Acanthaster planci]XP_022101113.1 extracellular tyrosine-protein kinase PKDCC-like [Acanthaster planci]XP_022101114.1 extracellular tyrosine-protein kinase PKDCC-like [Acanthaster planci]XP_022101115.1 extracellular tyrosine-protein kinase PKDCC-like [Acanthaster planci]